MRIVLRMILRKTEPLRIARNARNGSSTHMSALMERAEQAVSATAMVRNFSS